MDIDELRNRTRYRMRRGLLELDILMAGFKERGFEDLDEAGLEAFSRMLEWDDPALMRAIDGTEDPGPEYARVVELLRKSRPSGPDGAAPGEG